MYSFVSIVYYSRYFRNHGLKVQALMLPNGMFGSIFVAGLRHNDNGIQNMSGLNDYLRGLFLLAFMLNGRFPSIYADGIFTPMETIVPRFLNPDKTQGRINVHMAALRQSIEHLFAYHFLLFKGMHDFTRLQLFRSGFASVKMVIVSFFVWNCYQCIHESSRHFDVQPPTLEQYLPLVEILDTGPNLFSGLDHLYNYNYNYN
jgi:hypothetical protein